MSAPGVRAWRRSWRTSLSVAAPVGAAAALLFAGCGGFVIGPDDTGEAQPSVLAVGSPCPVVDLRAASGYAVGRRDPDQLVVGDFNGDGLRDVVARTTTPETGLRGLVELLGTGSTSDNAAFAAPITVPITGTTASPTGPLGAGDFNGDGRDDLAVVDGSRLRVLLSSGSSGVLLPPVDTTVGGSLVSLSVADLDGDGRADAVVADATGRRVVALHGRGNGTFDRSAAYALPAVPVALGLARINRDALLDVAAVFEGRVYVQLGRGDATFTPPAGYATPAGTTAIAFGDFDLDTFTDIAAASPGGLYVLWNAPNGYLAPVQLSPRAARAVVAADFDRDGRPDIAALGPGGAGTITVWRAAAARVLTPQWNLAAGNTLAVADLDRDGLPDLLSSLRAVGEYGRGQVLALRNEGIAGFDAGTRGLLDRTAATVRGGDLDGDGRDDLIVRDTAGAHWIVYGDDAGSLRRSANVVFDPGTEPVAIIDFNRDGYYDVLANVSGIVRVYLNNGNSTFRTAASLFGLTTPAGALLNADTIPDIVATDAAGRIAVFLGRGDGTFTQIPPGPAAPGPLLAVGDIDGDGRVDVVKARIRSDRRVIVSALRNLGGGIFAAPTSSQGGFADQLTGLVLADANGDRRADAAVSFFTSSGVTSFGGIGVFQSLGGGIFFPIGGTSLPGEQPRIAAIDFNLDGRAELAVGSLDRVVIARLASGTLVLDGPYYTGAFITDLAIADVDGDGLPDVAVAAGAVTALRNESSRCF